MTATFGKMSLAGRRQSGDEANVPGGGRGHPPPPQGGACVARSVTRSPALLLEISLWTS